MLLVKTGTMRLLCVCVCVCAYLRHTGFDEFKVFCDDADGISFVLVDDDLRYESAASACKKLRHLRTCCYCFRCSAPSRLMDAVHLRY